MDGFKKNGYLFLSNGAFLAGGIKNQLPHTDYQWMNWSINDFTHNKKPSTLIVALNGDRKLFVGEQGETCGTPGNIDIKSKCLPCSIKEGTGLFMEGDISHDGTSNEIDGVALQFHIDNRDYVRRQMSCQIFGDKKQPAKKRKKS